MIHNCNYPQCKKKGVDKIIDINCVYGEARVALPFCEYHAFIVMGGRFRAKIVGDVKIVNGNNVFDHEIVGPLLEVEIAEQVYSSIMMTKKNKDGTQKRKNTLE